MTAKVCHMREVRLTARPGEKSSNETRIGHAQRLIGRVFIDRHGGDLVLLHDTQCLDAMNESAKECSSVVVLEQLWQYYRSILGGALAQ